MLESFWHTSQESHIMMISKMSRLTPSSQVSSQKPSMSSKYDFEDRGFLTHFYSFHKLSYFSGQLKCSARVCNSSVQHTNFSVLHTRKPNFNNYLLLLSVYDKTYHFYFMPSSKLTFHIKQTIIFSTFSPH